LTPWSSSPRPGVKAGLPADAWQDEDTEVQHFQAQIFAEVAPGRRYSRRAFWRGLRGHAGRERWG